jgi:hypothetical protein
VGDLLADLFVEQGYTRYNPLEGCFEQGVSEAEHLAAQMPLDVQPRSFYGTFRTDTAELIAAVSSLRPILHIRDPRDCLVSLFYSLAYSHVLPDDEDARRAFLEDRERLRKIGVDGLAFLHVERGYWSTAVVRRVLKNRPDAIISKYEDMVTNFPLWLRSLNEAMGSPFSEESMVRRIAAANFAVEENPLNHKRQVTPGDFRRKLCKEAREALTEVYREDLEYFGYLI